MNREMKFRVWSKTINKMWYPKFALFESGCVYSKKEDYELLDEAMNGMSSLNEDNVIMQYTGIKDKNGKEIYDGDIVKFNNQIGEICFECGAFGIGVKDCVDYETLETYRGERFYGCLNDNFISLWEIYWNLNCVDSEIDEIEVIGNIYDNPELLEVE